MIAIAIGGALSPYYNLMNLYMANVVCEMFDNKVLVLDFWKGNKLQKLLGRGGRKHKYIKCIFDDCGDYREVYQKSQKIIADNAIDKVIYLRQQIAQMYNHSNYYVATSVERKMNSEDYAFTSYLTSKTLQQKYLFMKACSKHCERVIQFLDDVQEFTFDQTMKFEGKFYKTYLARTAGFIYMPTFELGLELYHKKIECEKTKDFVFYCTARSDDRRYLAERKEELESGLGEEYDIRIVCKGDAFSVIREELYNEKLAQAYFTLCVPAYSQSHFSIWRIFEALANDCLCLVLASNNLYDLRNTFPDICEVVETENLIIDDFVDLPEKIQELKPRRDVILMKLWETESYKKVTNFDWCQARWCRMLGEGR